MKLITATDRPLTITSRGDLDDLARLLVTFPEEEELYHPEDYLEICEIYREFNDDAEGTVSIQFQLRDESFFVPSLFSWFIQIDDPEEQFELTGRVFDVSVKLGDKQLVSYYRFRFRLFDSDSTWTHALIDLFRYEDGYDVCFSFRFPKSKEGDYYLVTLTNLLQLKQETNYRVVGFWQGQVLIESETDHIHFSLLDEEDEDTIKEQVADISLKDKLVLG